MVKLMQTRAKMSGKAVQQAENAQATALGKGLRLTYGDDLNKRDESLRKLVSSEPLSSIAVIARYPEQADLYYKGLRHGEVPNLRRVADQDFSFRPGVDVTDVRQVKGLEFDYVVIVECNLTSFPVDNEARHLLHIAATRAAHQLWVFSTGDPSMLVPDALRNGG